MFINHTSKQVTAKIVYYGPGLSGKTTNLQYIFSITNPKTRGELVSIETEIERTLFFDLLPINVGLIKGYQTKFQLYTVPGQIFYDSTRKMVLKGADGVVFIADSQSLMEGANIESIENLKTNLNEQNQLINELPVVFQFNKRDLNNISPVTRLNKVLNHYNNPHFEAVASSGKGVIETLREISTQTLKKIKDTLDQADHYMEQAPYIHFDANPEKEMMKREDIPVKKIAVDQVEESTSKGSLSDLESDPAYVPPAEPFASEQAVEKKEEKPKKEEKKEVKQATKKEKKPEEKKAEPKEEKWEEIVIDDSPFEVPEEKEIFDLKKEYKKSPEFALLDQLKDNSRITIIKKIKLKNPTFTINISDNHTEILQNVDVKITPETTIILTQTRNFRGNVQKGTDGMPHLQVLKLETGVQCAQKKAVQIN